MPRALALCTTLLLAGGCASSGPYWSREDQGAAEATELRERVTRLEAQLTAAESEKAALAERAARLERELAQLREGESPSADTGLTAPVSVEAADSAPARPMRTEIEQSDLDETDTTPAAEAGEAAPTTPIAGAQEPRALYERSLELLEASQLSDAEAGFRRFLAENPGSDLADNAQFWLAESALRRGDVAAALAGFRAVVENYPEGNKVPDALLKVGSCLATLGEAESAATVYRELLERFPATAAAEAARQRLGAP